MNSQAKYH